ncbi:MAG: riboflavin synthase [Planctomycetota bacterium]
MIQGTGPVVEFRRDGEEADLFVDLGDLENGLRLGDSVALSGVCCTLVGRQPAMFRLSAETLRRTWLWAAEPGRRLNLEPALRAGEPLGGHLVQGHVDTVGRILTAIDAVAGGELQVAVPAELRRFCVEKGSITIDGVSLTIARLEAESVWIAVIPHTAQVTTLGLARVGDPVNLEADVFGKYVDRLLEARFGAGWRP